MKITKRTLYAIRALIAISESGEISINDIAEKTEISRKFLEQIFIDLKKSGIIVAKRGVYGGYRLSKKPEKITMYSIMESVGEEIEVAPCITGDDCSTPCTAKNILVDIHEKLLEYTKVVSLKDIIERGGRNVEY
jgi:Rrf2 family protein